MSISDKVHYEEKQANISKSLIDIYHNMIKIYVQNSQFNKLLII